MKSIDEWIVAYDGTNPNHLAAAVSEFGVPQLVAGAVVILRQLDWSTARPATLFIRDACLQPSDLQSSFRAGVEQSEFLSALAESLSASNFRLRSNAAYTAGKLYFKQMLPTLVETLGLRRDSDPLLMSDLVFEIFSLERDLARVWDRANSLAASPNEISRWAAVDVIDRFAVHDPVGEVGEILTRLVNDPFAYVAAEATYRRAWFDPHIRLNSVPLELATAAQKEGARQLKALEPKLTYSLLGDSFWNWHKEPDYTTADILRFLETSEKQGRAD